MDTERIKELAKEVRELAEKTKDYYLSTSNPSSEITSALAALWDSCEEFKTSFESFSWENP